MWHFIGFYKTTEDRHGKVEELTKFTSRGIEVTTNTTTKPNKNSARPLPFSKAEPVTTTETTVHEIPAPLVAGVTAVAAVAAVGALATVGVPTAVAAGAVAATSVALSGNDDFVDVDGYYREDGTYVRGHNRTQPDGWEGNNFSS